MIIGLQVHGADALRVHEDDDGIGCLAVWPGGANAVRCLALPRRVVDRLRAEWGPVGDWDGRLIEVQRDGPVVTIRWDRGRLEEGDPQVWHPTADIREMHFEPVGSWP